MRGTAGGGGGAVAAGCAGGGGSGGAGGAVGATPSVAASLGPGGINGSGAGAGAGVVRTIGGSFTLEPPPSSERSEPVRSRWGVAAGTSTGPPPLSVSPRGATTLGAGSGAENGAALETRVTTPARPTRSGSAADGTSPESIGSGSTAHVEHCAGPRRTSKCRCGAVLDPVDPTTPMICPRRTSGPDAEARPRTR